MLSAPSTRPFPTALHERARALLASPSPAAAMTATRMVAATLPYVTVCAARRLVVASGGACP